MTITKTPAMIFPYEIDFSNDLDTAEVLTGTPLVTAERKLSRVDTTALVIATDPAPSIGTSTVIFTAQGGQIGDRHLIRVEVETNAGNTYEGDVNLDIVEAL